LVVAFPSFVLELDVLDQDRVGVGVEVGLGLEFGDPTPEDPVGERQLAGLIVDFDDDVLAEILQRRLGAQTGAEIPDLVRPLLEFLVVGDAAFERDGFIFGAARGPCVSSTDRRLRDA
jgi:hypothetical protein